MPTYTIDLEYEAVSRHVVIASDQHEAEARARLDFSKSWQVTEDGAQIVAVSITQKPAQDTA